MPKTLEDCRVPNCPNCNWPEVGRDLEGERVNVLILLGDIIRQIELQTGISVMMGFDLKGKLFVRTVTRNAKEPTR